MLITSENTDQERAAAGTAEADREALAALVPLAVRRRVAARLLDISPKSLDKLRPELAPRRIGNGAYRYLVRDLIAYAESRPSVCDGQEPRPAA